MAIQKDIGGGLFGSMDIELTQVGEVAETTKASCSKNGIGTYRTYTGDTQ